MNATLRRARGPLSASLALLGLALFALAQPSGPSPLSPPANGPRHADSTWNAFTHATIHVSPEKTLTDATLVIRDGRIVSVGDGAPSAGARVWDCTGQHLYPGFIDAYVEVDAPKPDRTTPGAHWSVKVTPQRSALDGTGLDDKTAESLRKLGFTAAAIAPKGGVFRGSSAVVSLAKPSGEASADRPPVYKKEAYQSIAFELRTEGRRRGGGDDTPDSEHWPTYPDSEMGAIALIRQTLIDADWQADARKAGATIAPNALDPLSIPNESPATRSERAEAEKALDRFRSMLDTVDPESHPSAKVVAPKSGGPSEKKGVTDPLEHQAAQKPRASASDHSSPAPQTGPGWDFSNNEVHVLDGPGAVDMPGPDVSVDSHLPMPINPGSDTAKIPTVVDRNAPAVRAGSVSQMSSPEFTLAAWSAIAGVLDGDPVRAASPAYTTLLFNTEDELEALRAAKIAREFHRPAAILGSGTEFRRLDAIKADGLPVILPLNYPKTPDVSSVGKAESVELRDLMTWEQAPTNARRLDAAGLKVALTTDKLKNRGDFEDNLRTALRCGLKPDRALAMLTTQPAEILGVADRLGTIEPGKQANLIVADADLFDPWPTKPDSTVGQPSRPPPLPAGGTPAPQGPESSKPAPTEGQKPAGKEGEPEKKPNADTPDETRATDLGGSGPRSGPDGNDDRPGRDRPKSKIREVWIDGIRHEIAPPPARDVYGTWKVIEINGKAIDEPDAEAVIFTVTQEGAVTYYRAGKSEKAANVRIAEDRLDYTIDAKKLFDIPAVLTDSAVVDEPDLMHGMTPMPSGKLHHWTAKRTSHDATPPASAHKTEPGASATGRASENPDNAAPPKDHTSHMSDEERAAQRKHLEEEINEIKTALASGESHKHLQDEPSRPLVAKDRLKKLEAELAALDTDSHTDHSPRKDADQEERDAIASIPETYGYPFGPYMLPQYPRQSKSLRVINATIWTSGPAGIIQNGELAIENGVIAYVGPLRSDFHAAADTQTIDAQGKHISPGIIDCHSHTGISRGVNESGQAVTAEVRIQDVTDPDSVSWYRQLAAGVTTVDSLHGSANAIGGQNCINKVRWGVKHPDEMHFEGAMPGIKFALGENPKESNWGDRQITRYPQTRMGVETLIRDRFTAAREYAASLKAAGLHADYTPMSNEEFWDTKKDAVQQRVRTEADGSVRVAAVTPIAFNPRLLGLANHDSLPHRDLELEALAEVLEGKRLVHCHSYRQDELLMLCRVADDFGFKIGTFQHVLEGYKVADEVARHSRGGSTFSDWWAYKVEVQDAIPENGPIMTSQGVVVSYNSDSDELARRLNTEAAKAVKYGGLKPEDALKYVTINPAFQLAISDKVGSLEKGKDADFVIWSGPPMSTFSRPEATYIDGRCLFSLEQDRAHRETIQKERTRLIQKALAAAKRKPPERAGQPGDHGLDGPWYRPTDDDAGGVQDAGEHHSTGILERYYLDLLNRGGDPTAAKPGECGCGGKN